MGYCTNCGRPVQAQAAFCTSCGAALRPPPQPAQAPGPAPAKPGFGLGRVLLIALGAVVLLGALGIAGLVYAGYRVKRAADQVAAEFGSGAARPAGPAARRTGNVCSLLSGQEAAQIAGVAVLRQERDEGACRYFGDPQEVAARAEAAAGDALARLRGGRQPGPEDLAEQAQQFARGLAALGAQTGKQEGLLFVVRVRWGDAASQEAAYRMAMRAMTAGLPPGAGAGGSLDGVGDRAYLAPMGGALYMVKGDAWVEIEGPGLASRDALIAVARRLAARM